MKHNFVIATIFLLIDQLLKYTIRTRLALNESFVHFGPFGIVHFENTAGPLSLPIPWFALLFIHILVLIGILLCSIKLPRYRTGLLWILSGGVSNLIDRILFSSTTDYIGLPFHGYWNLADVMVLIGSIIVLFTKPASPQGRP